MRTFIAITLPKEIKDFLARIQDTLKESGADVKWVNPENIHLTLKFLGEVDDATLIKAEYILQEVAKNKNPFYLGISSVGAFPKVEAARVIWAGIHQGETETKMIAKEFEDKFAKVGIPAEERAFSAHITLGRTRSGLNRQNLAQKLHALVQSHQEGVGFRVTKITLFKSTLTPKGPVYDILKEGSLHTTN